MTSETENILKKLSAAIEHGNEEILRKTASESFEHFVEINKKYIDLCDKLLAYGIGAIIGGILCLFL